MINKKTKIVCTLGPTTDNYQVMRRLAKNGMDVARINMSHQTHTEQAARIADIKAIRKELDTSIAIMLDTKGPEVRIKTFKDGAIELAPGQLFRFTFGDEEGDLSGIPVTYPKLYKYIKEGDEFSADDGKLDFKVVSTSKHEILCSVITGGRLSNRKSLNFPNSEIEMDYLSVADKADIKFGVEQGVDAVALSFVRSADDVNLAKDYLKSLGAPDMFIISKIENRQGVKNMDSIIAVSDGIMVARGDMGVEIPFEELPAIQKQLIKRCYKAGKISITATQMLESMISNPRPTRAEISDVANAVFDGTSCVMLSGETAMGNYPVETVKTMVKICKDAEKAINYVKKFSENVYETIDVTDAVSHTATLASHNLKAAAIIAATATGNTARKLCRYRPNPPVVAATTSEKAYYQLAFFCNTIPVLADMKASTDELIDHITQRAVDYKIVKKGDLVVMVAGVPVGKTGATNLMKVQTV